MHEAWVGQVGRNLQPLNPIPLPVKKTIAVFFGPLDIHTIARKLCVPFLDQDFVHRSLMTGSGDALIEEFRQISSILKLDLIGKRKPNWVWASRSCSTASPPHPGNSGSSGTTAIPIAYQWPNGGEHGVWGELATPFLDRKQNINLLTQEPSPHYLYELFCRGTHRLAQQAVQALNRHVDEAA